MERHPDAFTAYDKGKEEGGFRTKFKFDVSKELFKESNNNSQIKKENINELYNNLTELHSIGKVGYVKDFLAHTKELEFFDAYQQKIDRTMNSLNDNTQKWEKKLAQSYPELYQAWDQLVKLEHEESSKDPENVKQERYSKRFETAKQKLCQEHVNNTNLEIFLEKAGKLVSKYEYKDFLEKEKKSTEKIIKDRNNEIFEKYPDLYNNKENISKLIQRIRDIKAPVSTPHPEIQQDNPASNESKDQHKGLTETVEALTKQVEALTKQVEALTKQNEALTNQIADLPKQIADLPKQNEALTNQNEVDNTKGKKASSGFFEKLKTILSNIKKWLKNPFGKNGKKLDVNTQIDQPTKFGRVKKVFKGIGEFLRKVAKYTGLLRFARTFPHRYRKNSTWGKIGKGTLEVLGGIFLGGVVYMAPFYIYKTAKYNHKDVMHQKYSENPKGYYGNHIPEIEGVLIYRKEGKPEKPFFIRPDAKDRELAFLTRHPIPNTEKGNEGYETKKSPISKLTKAEVKALRKRNISETNDNSSEANGWSVISMEAYKELRSKFPELPDQKGGEN